MSKINSKISKKTRNLVPELTRAVSGDTGTRMWICPWLLCVFLVPSILTRSCHLTRAPVSATVHPFLVMYASVTLTRAMSIDTGTRVSLCTCILLCSSTQISWHGHPCQPLVWLFVSFFSLICLVISFERKSKWCMNNEITVWESLPLEAEDLEHVRMFSGSK